MKRGQEIALETAKVGAPVGAVDDAVRAYYEKEGWGPGYRLPGLSHRTGHGIGMDGHEPPNLVHGDATPLQPGMCFSDEPGLYIPGEFGIPHGRLLAHDRERPQALHAAGEIHRPADLSTTLR